MIFHKLLIINGIKESFAVKGLKDFHDESYKIVDAPTNIQASFHPINHGSKKTESDDRVIYFYL